MKTHNIQFKIFISTVLCVMIVSLTGTLYLYRYMSQVIYEKARHIDNLYLNTVTEQIDIYLANMIELGLQCSNDDAVIRAFKSSVSGDKHAGSRSLEAQQKLSTYLNSFSANSYVNKLIAFNIDHTMIQATSSREYGTPKDYERLITEKVSCLLKKKPSELKPYMINLGDSITKSRDTVLTMICPVYGQSNQVVYGYIYTEIGLDLFADLLAPYTAVNNLFLTDTSGRILTAAPVMLPQSLSLSEVYGGIYHMNGQKYEFSSQAIPTAGMRLYSCTDYPPTGSDGTHLLYIILLVLLMSLFIGILLAFLVSHYLSLPIQRLSQRLNKIANGDFSFDYEIERPKDELGQIGKTVNEMTNSFSNLLKDTQNMYKHQKSIEIALLQSQVNPHFLYNTLDSIHWMAVIQKNTGIQQMAHSLCSLLKNLAKGTEDHILLKEELSLLKDYIAIQSIRYMEVFEMVDEIPEELHQYRILKFTLQPLIENSIFHGIEPKGICGTIILSGWIQDNYLFIRVKDNGMGIPESKLKDLLSAPQQTKNKGSLNSIGVYNVNQRLKLVYGPEYGLSYESEVQSYTQVTIKLPLEL
ncbi:sensor histidine kinase [Hungatella hathewayi]|uniref:sensor histidine kinase n=1 Tax=Hungatella hathewayi TaxID=154046 RepID=UPI003564C5D0